MPVVAGLLASPTPAMTFDRRRSGPSRASHRRRLLGRSLGMTTFMVLSSPSERSSERWIPLAGFPPLLGFVGSSRHRHASHASTQEPKPQARRCHPPDTFRPRGFSPPRRFTPRERSRVYCTPLPIRDSPRFVRPARDRTRRRARWRWQSPRRGSYPPKTFPRRQPHRITAAVAILSLPPTRPRHDQGRVTASHPGRGRRGPHTNPDPRGREGRGADELSIR
jgi:hypothetical protein